MALKGATKELTKSKEKDTQETSHIEQRKVQTEVGPPTPEFYLTKQGLQQIQNIINDMPTRFGFPLMQILEQNITPTK